MKIMKMRVRMMMNVKKVKRKRFSLVNIVKCKVMVTFIRMVRMMMRADDYGGGTLG